MGFDSVSICCHFVLLQNEDYCCGADTRGLRRTFVIFYTYIVSLGRAFVVRIMGKLNKYSVKVPARTEESILVRLEVEQSCQCLIFAGEERRVGKMKLVSLAGVMFAAEQVHKLARTSSCSSVSFTPFSTMATPSVVSHAQQNTYYNNGFDILPRSSRLLYCNFVIKITTTTTVSFVLLFYVIASASAAGENNSE